jgi:hypothetical protein
MDGTLLGVVGAVAVLAGLTLHWQHRWTVQFNRLESTRIQAHRLTESTAVMEQHLLRSTTQPASLVPTQVSNLVHVERPRSTTQPAPQPSFASSLGKVTLQRPRSGY